MGFKFGTFETICDTAALQVCPLLTTAHGQAPTCYARNVELGGTLVFQPGQACRLPSYTHTHIHKVGLG